MNKQFWIVPPQRVRTGFAFKKNKKLLSNKQPHPIEDIEPTSSPSFLADAPSKVFFDMTYLCNLNCKHCSTNSAPWRDTRKEMTTSRIIEVIEELAAVGINEIEVGGGEPLMHPYWFFIFKQITDLGLDLVINSNGHMMNERNLQYLRTVKPTEVQISFEGSRELQNYIRGKDAYDKALKGLKNLIANGTPTSARLTFCSTTIIDIEKCISDIAETGCQKIVLHTIKNMGRAETNIEFLTPKPNQEIINWFKEMGKNVGITIHLSETDFPSSFSENQIDNQPAKLDKGFTTCHISPLGHVSTDVGPASVEIGNINKQSFMSVWRGQKANGYRKSTGELISNSDFIKYSDSDYER